MRVIRSADYRRMPWKNGGGETREIAVSPAGATLDTLEWRVSLARVATAGPFSIFKGVQRTLCVIRGSGIRLQAGDRAPVDLHVTSKPYTFDGEVATSAELIEGPIEDLNVMTRRGRFRHSVRRLISEDTFLLETSAQTAIIYCQRGAVQCVAGGESASLQSDDSAMFIEPEDSLRAVPCPTADILLVELWAE